MDPLIEALRAPACYPHAAAQVEVIETHISWVLLAGEYAYKVKKPVRLAFVDFSTLALRRHCCEEELRLNRRTAPALYLDVVPVVQTANGPAFGGRGTPVEYAVRMRRFATDALADRMARRGALDANCVDAMATALTGFHAAAPRAGPADGYATPAQVTGPAIGNFDQLATQGVDPGSAAVLARLREWTSSEGRRLAPVFVARLAGGCVRECHGDLHLGNIAFIDGRAVPFDCIEFDPALRWIDVASEVAFLFMDLRAHGLDAAAWRLLNAWLEASGDYASLAVLRYYLVYRAMVRAKIALLRDGVQEFHAYLALAGTLAGERRAALVAMHGLSGCGKTTLAQALLERVGAVRLRSDVERKRLHGIDDPARRAGSGLAAGIYTAQAAARTYAVLAGHAASILLAGYAVVVDAAFLQREQRDDFRRLARERGASFVIAACHAPVATLRRRLATRQAQARDASDADAAVLEHQLATHDRLAADEEADALWIGTETEDDTRAGIERVVSRCAPMNGERALPPG